MKRREENKESTAYINGHRIVMASQKKISGLVAPVGSLHAADKLRRSTVQRPIMGNYSYLHINFL